MNIGIAVLSNFETSFAFKELNLLTADIAAGGILHIGNELKPSVSNDIVTIASGVIAFNGGTRLRISESATFAANDGYIYAAYSSVTQTGGLYFATALPRSEYIPVCTISGGAITDTRKYAKYSIAKPNGNEFLACTVGTGDYVTGEWREQATYEMPDDYDTAIVQTYNSSYDVWRRVDFVDGGDSEEFSMTLYSRGTSTSGDAINNCIGKISRSGRTLTFWAKKSNGTTEKYYPRYALAGATFYLV